MENMNVPVKNVTEQNNFSPEFLQGIEKIKDNARKSIALGAALTLLSASIVAYSWNKDVEKDSKVKAKIEKITNETNVIPEVDTINALISEIKDEN